MRRALAFAAAAAALAWPAIASADRVYHSEHMPLLPVAAAPLTQGFVENVHPNGPNVYAHEIYVLNGAAADASYEVFLLVYVGDPDCSEAAAAQINTATITTNAAGNGRADAFIRPEEVEGIRNATHGVRWEIKQGGTVVYQTACTAVTLD
jgi:hypothetical protein